MSRPQSNPVRYAPLLSAEALLLTLAVHGLLLFGFSYEPPKPAASTRSAGSLFLLKTPSGARGKAFCRWLEYHDPAAMVRSRGTGGYQSCLPREKSILPAAPALRYSTPKVPDFVIPSATKVEIPAPVPAGYLPQVPLPPEQKKQYPFALFDSGRMVPLDVMPAVLAALGKLPDSPSRIRLGESGKQKQMRRFSIQHSSGNRNADLLALQLVLSCAAPQEKGCSVYWKSGKEETK